MPSPAVGWRALVTGPAIVMVVHAIVAFTLASRLAPDVWTVSDPGARLVAAENVLRHPARPFEVDLPAIPADLANEWRQPYFVPHGGHAHAMTPQAFPILVAPFLAAFGLPGLLVVPILAWVAMGPLTAKLAAAVGVDVPPLAVVTLSIIGTPFVFYGLEFWEHTPAVACVIGAAALLLTRSPSRDALWSSRIAGGALAMLAIQLRPEAAPAALAVALVLLLRRSWPSLLALGIGAGVMALPFVAYNLSHFGDVSSPHVKENLTVLSSHWMSERLRYASTWFVPTRATATAAYAVMAFGWLLAWIRFRTAGMAISLAAAMFLAVQMAQGHELKENFLRVFPIALLALVPMARPPTVSRDLLILMLVPLVGAWLTAPNDGAFWGPRYLMPIVPLVLLIAVTNMTALMRRSWIGKAAVAWFVLAGIVVSLGAYRELRGTKRNYARMVHQTVAAATGTKYIVTTAWWVPAAHAGVRDVRTMVYVETPSQMAQVLRAIAPAEVLAVSEIDMPGFAFSEGVAGTCYVAQPTKPHAAGRLQSARLSCR